MNIERFNRSIKTLLKPNLRVDETLDMFLRLDMKFLRKDLSVAMKIRGDVKLSRWQVEFPKLHPTERDMENYEISEVNGTVYKLKVTKKNNERNTEETVHYTLKKNYFKCNRALCEIRCQECPNQNCVHDLTCTCSFYGLRHQHIIATLAAVETPNPEHNYIEADMQLGLEEGVLEAELIPPIIDDEVGISLF